MDHTRDRRDAGSYLCVSGVLKERETIFLNTDQPIEKVNTLPVPASHYFEGTGFGVGMVSIRKTALTEVTIGISANMRDVCL